MAVTGLQERASLVQRDLVSTVARFRPERARTLATFEEGTRSKTARLAGIQIPYWKDHAHGQTWYNPLANDTSFKKSIKQQSGAMYAGVAFRNMNFFMEDHIMLDMQRGFIPDSYIEERARRIDTHMMKKNWAAIGNGTGAIAFVISSAAGLLTCAADNAARGRSKGSFRIKTSTVDDQLLYDVVNTATDTVVATFYCVSKPSGTQANVIFTFGGDLALAANMAICENGSWKREMLGLGAHISDENRIYQGVDTSVDDFLKNPSVNAGNAAVTPTTIFTAKGIMQTRGNGGSDDVNYVCHLTPGNYRTLATYGYAARQYQAAEGKASKTFGLPDTYVDGDTVFVPDTDYEDCYIDFREKGPYFEYVQKKFGLKKDGDGNSNHEWIGQYQVGSTNSYENYNEACNIVWDGRGAKGDGKGGGTPGSAVFIKNIAMPAETQVAYGI
ncbi:MAG TPA: hypothetical protein VNI84_12155 [Pyrinomonadaceae bacterium]|nr:hypothetical protein [Pyrinomonadaceae bacterium]